MIFSRGALVLVAGAMLIFPNAGLAQIQTDPNDPSSAIHELGNQVGDSLISECPKGDVNVDSCIYRPILRNQCLFLATSASIDLDSIIVGRMSFAQLQQDADNETGDHAITDENVVSILKAGGIKYTPIALLHAVYNVCMTNFKN